jgi:hypothetical protein
VWIHPAVEEVITVPEVGLGAITTPLGVFQLEFVVHCLAESLLAAEIAFGGLNRCVSKQKTESAQVLPPLDGTTERMCDASRGEPDS